MKSKFLNNVSVYIGIEMMFQANDTDFQRNSTEPYNPLFPDKDNTSDTYNGSLSVEFDHK